MNTKNKLFMLIVAVAAISACPQDAAAQYGSRYSYPSPTNYNRSAYTTPMSSWNNYKSIKSGGTNYSRSYSGNARRFSSSTYGQQPGTYHRYSQQGKAYSKGTLYNSRVYNGNRHPVNKYYDTQRNPPKTKIKQKAPTYQNYKSRPRNTPRGRTKSA